MKVNSLSVPEIKLIMPTVHRDDRGFFCETFSARALRDSGINATFVQDNHSLSVAKGVVRGLHFQTPPHGQGKLVRVVRGAILDVAVDIRKGSPTFGGHVAEHLTAENFHQLWIPVGFAHGFVTLTPNTEVVYKVTDYYAPDCDRGLAWDDPDLAIDWNIATEDATLSEKDKNHPRLKDLQAPFTYSNEAG